MTGNPKRRHQNIPTHMLYLVCLLHLTGCSKKHDTENQDHAAELPVDLQAMQGSWENDDTNAFFEFKVTFDRYTMRLLYKKTQDDLPHRQNTSIRRIDDDRKILILNQDLGVWHYQLPKPEKKENQLHLIFTDTSGQHHVTLRSAR